MRHDSGCCKVPAPALHVPPRGSISGSPCRVQWGGSRRQESLTITMLVIVIVRVFISATTTTGATLPHDLADLAGTGCQQAVPRISGLRS